MKKTIYRLVGLAILAAAGWGGYGFFKQLPERQERVPTTKVQRSDVVIRAYSRGELRAVRSVTLTAPNLFGTVQTTRLAPMGSLAKEKDLVVEYDDSERKASLEEAQLSVESVDEQIKKAKADLAIQQSQDAVTLLKTRYDVRRAELEVQRNPIISAIDAKKNLLNLEQSKRALLQLESDIQSRQAQADSQLAVFEEQRNRSLIDVQREVQRIAQTKTLAPITGLVAIKQNRAGNFNFGQQLPDIREGDTLQPGMPVVDVLDLSELEVWAKVGELDRANLREGEEALFQLDAIPEKRFRGKIKAMSGTATSDVFSGDPSKKFDVIFSIDMRQLLAGLGMKPGDVDRIMATAEANGRKTGGPGPGVAGGGRESVPLNSGINAGGRGASPNPNRPAAPGLANPLEMMRRTSLSPYTEQERNNAKLPLPPEQDSQVQVLLRPGLLADVEIQVEKLPNVIHVPAQAVFDRNGKYVVFVEKNRKFEAREVQLVKQSESLMVLAGGVQAGEVVALADPSPGKSDKKGNSEKKASGGNMGGLPGGK